MNYKTLICSICLVFIMNGTLVAQSQAELQRLVDQHMAKQQRERSRSLQEMRRDNPALAEYEEELLNISKEIRTITADCAEGRISKKAAAARLRPLIKQSMEINSDADYLTEKQIYDILYSAK